MKRKTLKSPQELQLFQDACKSHLGIAYPMEYLERSKVVSYWASSKVVGGYILCKKGPFRVIESIPESSSHLNQDNYLFFLNQNKRSMEITGLFYDRKTTAYGANFKFWIYFCWDIITSGKRYFCYAYDPKKEHLRRIYKILNPRRMFCGVPKPSEGMNYKPEVEAIEFATTASVAKGMVSADYLLNKLLLKKSKQKKITSQKIIG